MALLLTCLVSAMAAENNLQAQKGSQNLMDSLRSVESKLKNVRTAKNELTEIVRLREEAADFLEEMEDNRNLGLFAGSARQEMGRNFNAMGTGPDLPLDILTTCFQGISLMSGELAADVLPDAAAFSDSADTRISVEKYLNLLDRRESELENRHQQLRRQLTSD